MSTWARIDREAGYALMGRLRGPEAVEDTFGRLDGLAPGFGDWTVTALFGGTYRRKGLAPRDRQIVNLAALTALGGVEPQLDDHVRNSLQIGVEPHEIVEVMVHPAPHVGLPKALAGLRVASSVFHDVGANPLPPGGAASQDTAPRPPGTAAQAEGKPADGLATEGGRA